MHEDTRVSIPQYPSIVRCPISRRFLPLSYCSAAIDERLLTNQSSPLHLACANGHLDAVKVLVQEHALVNTGNGYGNAPIQSALIGGHRAVRNYETNGTGFARYGRHIHVTCLTGFDASWWKLSTLSVDTSTLCAVLVFVRARTCVQEDPPCGYAFRILSLCHFWGS